MKFNQIEYPTVAYSVLIGKWDQQIHFGGAHTFLPILPESQIHAFMQIFPPACLKLCILLSQY